MFNREFPFGADWSKAIIISTNKFARTENRVDYYPRVSDLFASDFQGHPLAWLCGDVPRGVPRRVIESSEVDVPPAN